MNESRPVALYKGSLPVGGFNLECTVLDNDLRVLSATSVIEVIGHSEKEGLNLESQGVQLPEFLKYKNLEPFIGQDVMKYIRPITYRDGDCTKTGYDSSLLPLMCSVYLAARRSGVLTQSQEKLADKAEVLLGAFAQVGIAALIDEATGFQRSRKHEDLRLLLSGYLAKGLSKWITNFPDSFFFEIDRLYKNETISAIERPQLYGGFINQYIYAPAEERGERGIGDKGGDFILLQIGRVQGLMEQCFDIEEFKRKYESTNR